MNRKKSFDMNYIFSAESIDRCSEDVGKYLENIKTDKKEIMRIRLSVEGLLLRWREFFGDGASFKLSCYFYLGQPTVRVSVDGEPCDPLSEKNGELGVWAEKLLSSLQATPVYSYSRNANTVTFKFKKKSKSPLFWLLIALVSSALVGGAGFLLPESARLWITNGFLVPLCNTYISVLNFFGIPLIFLSVLLGIFGVGDTSSFGKIGKKMILHFMLSLFIVTAVTQLVAFPFFNFNIGSSTGAFSYGKIFNMFLGFLPTSLVTPFIDCNAMQLVILGIIMGIALVTIHPIAKGLSDALDGLNQVLLIISQWFTKLIPFFVFFTIVKSVWSGQLSDIFSASKSWILTVGIQLIFVLIMIGQICLKHKVSAMTIIKKITGTFLISLGTNSCCATIPELYSSSDKLGVSPDVYVFGIPIGTSVFKPSCAVRLVLISYFFASVYNIEISFMWFVLVGIMAFVLSIAVPAIPGGALIFFPMLFSQLGIPAEAMTAVIATDIFFDAFCTAFCQVSAELALVQQAGTLSLLDKEKLHKI